MGFEELKARQAVVWGAAPFERIAATLADMHDAVIEALDPRAGERWLDVGCGTGDLLFRGLHRGAEQVGADLAPALVETARRRAEAHGAPIAFEVADAEDMPFWDASFDVVSSSVGAIFAPDHERVAAELARVCRPGGRLAMTAWTAEGEIGDFFRTIGRYAPPPAPGAGDPLDWGAPGHAERLLGEHFEVDVIGRNAPWRAPSADAMWDDFATAFGPVKVLLERLEADVAGAFRADMIELFGRSATSEGIVMERPYVLVLGRRRG